MLEIKQETSVIPVKAPDGKIHSIVVPKPLPAAASLRVATFYESFKRVERELNNTQNSLIEEGKKKTPSITKVDNYSKRVSEITLELLQSVFSLLNLTIINYEEVKPLLDLMSLQNLLDLFGQISGEMTSGDSKKKSLAKSRRSSKK